MQDDELLAKYPPDDKQRFDQYRQVGKVLDEFKDSTRVADYEAYLRQYPEGSFVALARTRLGEFASAAGGMRDPNDREVELSFWESVRESDNPASLQAYLEKYPDGEFKSLAEIRLSELRVPPISS